MTMDGTTVLQIRYAENFVDTFRVQGRHVDKAGTMFGNTGFAHWSERLQQRK